MLRLVVAAASYAAGLPESNAADAGRGARSPVVLVPGLVGSRLEARLHDASMPHWWCLKETHGKWVPTWIVASQLLPGKKDCLVRRLTLVYDAGSDTYANAPGVEIRPQDFGGVSGLDFLDPPVEATKEFRPLIDKLAGELNYTVGVDLHGATYDWRLAADAHARPANGIGGLYPALKALLEETVQRSGRRATLVSHSLGCPTTLAFLHTFVSAEWRAAHVRQWVALGAPWLGAATQAEAYLGGMTFGVPIVPHDYVQPVQVNATSGAWLAPHPLAFGSEPVVSTPSANYSAAELPALVDLLGERSSQAAALLRKARGGGELDLEKLMRPPPGVPVHNWISSGVRTPRRFVYGAEITAGFDQAPVEVVYGDGDGIANAETLRAPERWPEDASAPVETRVFPGVAHQALLFDAGVHDAILGLLRGPDEAGRVVVV